MFSKFCNEKKKRDKTPPLPNKTTIKAITKIQTEVYMYSGFIIF